MEALCPFSAVILCYLFTYFKVNGGTCKLYKNFKVKISVGM